MTKQEMRDLLAARMSDDNAPEIRVIPEGERTIDPSIRHCQCGCEGDWTEHTMRLGERGICGNQQ